MKRFLIPAFAFVALAAISFLAVRAQDPAPKAPTARAVSRYLIGFPEGKETEADGSIAIHAAADLTNLKRDVPLVWFVRVTRPTKDGKGRDVVWQHDYAEQAFTLPRGERLTPEFAETLQMPPGRYRVAVGLKQRRGTGESVRWDEMVSDTLRATVK